MKNKMTIQCQCQCNNGILQPEPRKLNIGKFARELRATPLECRAMWS